MKRKMEKIFKEMTQILDSPDWLQYMPENFLESALMTPEPMRVAAAEPMAKVVLAHFIREECVRVDSLKKAEEIPFLERVKTPHFTMRSDNVVRMEPLPAGSHVELIRVEKGEIEKEFQEFFKRLVAEAQTSFEKAKAEGDQDALIRTRHDILLPGLREVRQQKDMNSDTLFLLPGLREVRQKKDMNSDTLCKAGSQIALETDDPSRLTWLRQCMRILSTPPKSYADFGIVLGNQLFDVKAPGQFLLVFCCEGET